MEEMMKRNKLIKWIRHIYFLAYKKDSFAHKVEIWRQAIINQNNRPKKCIDCRFYEKYITMSAGECMFNPPINSKGTWNHAQVYDNDWCGQFKGNMK